MKRVSMVTFDGEKTVRFISIEASEETWRKFANVLRDMNVDECFFDGDDRELAQLSQDVCYGVFDE